MSAECIGEEKGSVANAPNTFKNSPVQRCDNDDDCAKEVILEDRRSCLFGNSAGYLQEELDEAEKSNDNKETEKSVESEIIKENSPEDLMCQEASILKDDDQVDEKMESIESAAIKDCTDEKNEYGNSEKFISQESNPEKATSVTESDHKSSDNEAIADKETDTKTKPKEEADIETRNEEKISEDESIDQKGLIDNVEDVDKNADQQVRIDSEVQIEESVDKKKKVKSEEIEVNVHSEGVKAQFEECPIENICTTDEKNVFSENEKDTSLITNDGDHPSSVCVLVGTDQSAETEHELTESDRKMVEQIAKDTDTINDTIEEPDDAEETTECEVKETVKKRRGGRKSANTDSPKQVKKGQPENQSAPRRSSRTHKAVIPFNMEKSVPKPRKTDSSIVEETIDVDTKQRSKCIDDQNSKRTLRSSQATEQNASNTKAQVHSKNEASSTNKNRGRKKAEENRKERSSVQAKTRRSERVSKVTDSENMTSKVKQKTAKSSPSVPSKMNTSKEKDPFSFDTNCDNHPEPFHNIQMERRSFGACRFTKAPSTDISKYAKIEQAASERRCNLMDVIPGNKPAMRKSLIDLSVSSSVHRDVGEKKRGRKKLVADSGTLFSDVLDQNEGEDEVQEQVEVTRESKRGKRKLASRSSNSPSPPRKLKRNRGKNDVTSLSEEKIVKLSADEQMIADRNSRPGHFVVGSRIFALWDKIYYAATVNNDRDIDGRHTVVFANDNLIRSLVVTGMIPILSLMPGKTCSVLMEDQLKEGIICEIPSADDPQKWFEGEYLLEIPSLTEKRKFYWSDIVVTMDQAKDYETLKVNTAFAVIADNIGTSRRRRKMSGQQLDLSSTSQLSTKKQKRTLDVSNVTPENVTRGKKPKRQPTSSEKAQDGIFVGIHFVITSAMRRNKDDESFSKREVKQLIELRSGVVVDDFSTFPENKRMLLIADTHYRTQKYLSALVRSIPCIKHTWVYDCVENNELLDIDNYMLPAGTSLITGEDIPWHNKNGSLLEGKRISICSRFSYPETSSNVPDFFEIWSPLIKHMGGSVVSCDSQRGRFEGEIDILLTDSTCPIELVNEAQRLEALIVSSEWLIQCMITGSLVNVDAHERFRHNFVQIPAGTVEES